MNYIKVSKLKETIFKLLSFNFNDDSFDPDGNETCLDLAYEIVENYPSFEIQSIWQDFLYNECKTFSEILNCCNLLVYYGWHELHIPNIYQLAGYLYWKAGESTHIHDDSSDIIEDIILSALQNQGYVDLMKEPYYMVKNDPKIIAEVEKYKEKNEGVQ